MQLTIVLTSRWPRPQSQRKQSKARQSERAMAAAGSSAGPTAAKHATHVVP
jgi:hypothetical protein